MNSVNLGENLIFQTQYEELISRDDIVDNLRDCVRIYNDKTIQFMYDLFYLKRSALYIDEELDDDIDYPNLVRSKFFRQLVAYNLYYRYKNMKIGESYFNPSPKTNYFNICSSRNDSLLYAYDYSDIVPNVYLYKDKVLSVNERCDKMLDELAELKRQLDSLKLLKNPYGKRGIGDRLTFGNPSKDWIFNHNLKIEEVNSKIKMIEGLSDADIKKQYNDDVYVHTQRKKIMDYFLKDCNLDINLDFEEERQDKRNRVLVKEYGFANVYIMDQEKHII